MPSQAPKSCLKKINRDKQEINNNNYNNNNNDGEKQESADVMFRHVYEDTKVT